MPVTIKETLPRAIALRVGGELRELREVAGLKLDEVARVVGWDKARLSRVERGMIPCAVEDIVKLLEFFGVEGEERDSIEAMARGGRRQEWWRAYNEYLTPSYSQYLALESEATRVREYQNTLPPGIMQTESYARAVIANAWSGRGEDLTDALIEVRMTRRRRYLDDPERKFHVLIGEVVREYDTGGPAVMREQFEQLASDAQRPNVTLQVVPFSAGRRGVVESGVTILDFAVGEPAFGFMESAGSMVMHNSPRESKRCVKIFEHLLGSALSPEESVERIISWTGQGS
jgi:transcriptional regulator with XRE-family HTH domain